MYEIFEQLMKEKGVRAADVARATGIAPQTFSAWKKGESSPKSDKLQKIADYFGVSLEYLTTGVNPDGYYYDKESAEIAQEIYQNKELHLLFDMTRDAKPEDLRYFAQMLLLLKKREKYED